MPVNNQVAHVFWSGTFTRVDGCDATRPNPGEFLLTFPAGFLSVPKNQKLTISLGSGTAAFATWVFVSATQLLVYVWDGSAAPPVKFDPDAISITVEIVPRVS